MKGRVVVDCDDDSTVGNSDGCEDNSSVGCAVGSAEGCSDTQTGVVPTSR